MNFRGLSIISLRSNRRKDQTSIKCTIKINQVNQSSVVSKTKINQNNSNRNEALIACSFHDLHILGFFKGYNP